MLSKNKSIIMAGFLAMGILFLFLAFFLGKSENQDQGSQLAKVSRQTGQVVVSGFGMTKRNKIEKTETVQNLDTIQTDDIGEAILNFETGQEILILPSSVVTIEKLDAKENLQILLLIKSGDIKVKKTGREHALYIAKNGQRTASETYQDSDLNQAPTQEIQTPESTQLNQQGLSEDEITATLSQHRTQFFKCFTRLLQLNPKVKGEAALTFTIQNNGHPNYMDVTTDLEDESFKNCLLEVMGRIEFKPFHGSPISTVFPLKFELKTAFAALTNLLTCNFNKLTLKTGVQALHFSLMMKNQSLLHFAFVSLIISTSVSSFAQERLDIEVASKGLPQVSEYLSADGTFVEVKAKRLKDAQVLWVNHDLLNEMGIAIPPEGITPEFEQKILDAFAYVVPRENDSPSEFLNKEKTFYADRYGGQGVGYALGSGRAAGAGMFQIKGLGRTALAETYKPPEPKNKKNMFSFVGIFQRVWDKFVEDNHNHGGATLQEAMSEAVWGEILHNELPYGANRIAVIIGTRQAIGIAKSPRALIVRQNSLRPAHFIKSVNRPDEETKIERERVEKLIEPFSKLPIIQNETGGTGKKLNLVVKEIFDRVGKKYGTEYAHSIFHGSSSPSNIEITGRAIDHGPLTALDGFTKALNVDNFANGDVKLVLYDILYELVEDLRKTVSVEYHQYIPTKPELRDIVTKSYNRQIRKELLWRFGLPHEMADQMMNRKSGQQFAEALYELAQIGNEEIVSTKIKAPMKTGKYNMNLVMKTLAEVNSNEDKADNLSRLIENKRLRDQLFAKYLTLRNDLSEIKTDQKIIASTMDQYIEYASIQRNQTFRELMRGGLMYVRQYLHMVIWTLTRSSKSISSYVETMTTKYGRAKEVFKESDLVLKEQKDFRTGAVVREVFDAEIGKNKVQIVAFESNGLVRFFNSEFKLDEIQQGKEIRIRNANHTLVRVFKVGNKIVMDTDFSTGNLRDYQKVELNNTRFIAPMCTRTLVRAAGF